jgi:uncharacterized SAM-binding protein YcdF (DUF218 family)
MILVSRLVEALLLPPGTFLVALALALLLLRGGRPRTAGALVAATVLGLYAVSTMPVAQGLVAPLERVHPPLHATPDACDAIVVLGYGARQAPEASSPELHLRDTSLRRTLTAWRLWQAAPHPVVLLGGRPFADNPPGESRHRAALLGELGVPADQLHTLDSGRTTHEEAQAVADLAGARGWHRLCVVTSAWHLPRAVAAFRHAGLAVTPVPGDTLGEMRPFTPRALLPSAAALRVSAAALREYVGLAYYRLRYGVRLDPPRALSR